ncbi:MAG: hypothetical protein ACJ8H8_11185, partial [Geminicoccaceae bacterium]
SDPANFPRVLAYWRAVPEDEGAIARNRRLYAEALAGLPVLVGRLEPRFGGCPRALFGSALRLAP